MTTQPTPPSARLAEFLAALSLAMDLGLGQPLEHVLRSTLFALHLAEQAGASHEERTVVYWVAMLRFLGCTADGYEAPDLGGGEDLEFRRAVAPLVMGDGRVWADFLRSGNRTAAPVAGGAAHISRLAAVTLRAHCEVGATLADRIGCAPPVCHALRHAFERWDGRGQPDGLSGAEIPFAVRVAVLARDLVLLTGPTAPAGGWEVVRARRGRAYDPDLVDLALSEAPFFAELFRKDRLWDRVLAAEPGTPRMIGTEELDGILEVFGAFVDLKVPFTHGHSGSVARLSDAAGRAAGLPEHEVVRLRRAGLVHDLGRVGVANRVWRTVGPLSEGDWERVRLHPYLTERILARSGPLAELAKIAGAHHERLDGSGYHKGLPARQISQPARILAAADAFQAMTEPRSHRQALSVDQAALEISAEARAGRLDRDAVDAVLASAGRGSRRIVSPRRTRLTPRELEVLRLLCDGHPNREIGRRLGISPKTVDHHIRHIYGKMGVSTRAGAAVHALELGVLSD